MVNNNCCESFNGAILQWRDKPIVTMLEGIRTYVMTRITSQKDLAEKCHAYLMPRPQAKLELNKNKGMNWYAHRTGTMHQVSKGLLDSFIVDIHSRTCSCKSWSLSGIPCAHACATMVELNHKPEEHVDPCYRKVTQSMIYSYFIMPCNGYKLWFKGKPQPILPPKFRRLLGRPKKKRRRSANEEILQNYLKLGHK